MNLSIYLSLLAEAIAGGSCLVYIRESQVTCRLQETGKRRPCPQHAFRVPQPSLPLLVNGTQPNAQMHAWLASSRTGTLIRRYAGSASLLPPPLKSVPSPWQALVESAATPLSMAKQKYRLLDLALLITSISTVREPTIVLPATAAAQARCVPSTRVTRSEHLWEIIGNDHHSLLNSTMNYDQSDGHILN